MPRRACLLAIAAAWIFACAVSPAAADPPSPSFAHLREARVGINSDGKNHVFRAWIADTPESRASGLMYVRALPPDQAMLFLFERPHFASFWMKNTYIPLDLMFVSPDGRIANIIENAEPLSLAPLESVVPVAVVLEVAGGTASRLGIRAGDPLQIEETPLAVTP